MKKNLLIVVLIVIVIGLFGYIYNSNNNGDNNVSQRTVGKNKEFKDYVSLAESCEKENGILKCEGDGEQFSYLEVKDDFDYSRMITDNFEFEINEKTHKMTIIYKWDVYGVEDTSYYGLFYQIKIDDKLVDVKFAVSDEDSEDKFEKMINDENYYLIDSDYFEYFNSVDDKEYLMVTDNFDNNYGVVLIDEDAEVITKVYSANQLYTGLEIEEKYSSYFTEPVSYKVSSKNDSITFVNLDTTQDDMLGNIYELTIKNDKVVYNLLESNVKMYLSGGGYGMDVLNPIK